MAKNIPNSSLESPLISIIIPCFNCEDYIAECLESCLVQTYDNIEIIVVDDGSDDKSYSIAIETSKKHKEKVFVYHQQNKGAASARNFGLSKSKGEFIQFLDADDTLSKDKIYNQFFLLKENINKVCVCDTIYFSNKNNFQTNNPESKEFIKNFDSGFEFLINLYGSNKNKIAGMIPCHAYLTPRNVIQKAGAWDESLSNDDDGEFFCRVLLSSSGTIVDDQSFTYYRKFHNKESLSALTTFDKFKSAIKAIDLKHSHLSNANAEYITINEIICRQFMEIGVLAYPRFNKITKYCMGRIAILGGTDYVPIIGGIYLELIKTLLGWKTAKMLSHLKNKLFR